MRVLLVVFALAGCGRVGFADGSDGVGGGDDGGDVAGPCPSSAVLCDDFESGDISMWSGLTVSLGGASVTASAAQPRNGGFSLDANVPMLGNGTSANVIRSIPLRTTGVLAARLWILAPTMFTRFDAVVRFWHTPTNQYMVVGCDSTNHWTAGENDGVGVIDHVSTVPCGPGPSWHCVEQVYSLDSRRVEVYIDGANVIDEAVADPAPKFSQVDVGAVRADAAGFRVFVDDVVIADQRIGCQ